MNKSFLSLLLATLFISSGAYAAKSTVKEETTCGFVVSVDKAEQLVKMKPISASGQVENMVITRRVLPESVSMAKLVKGHPRIKFCIQVPVAQGGHYKTWAISHKAPQNRVSSL